MLLPSSFFMVLKMMMVMNQWLARKIPRTLKVLRRVR
jgi:hypothetical protein